MPINNVTSCLRAYIWIWIGSWIGCTAARATGLKGNDTITCTAVSGKNRKWSRTFVRGAGW